MSGCHSFDQPLAVQTCAHQTCPQWIVGDWNDCSETCGQGFQERVVECLSPEDGQILSPENCSEVDVPSKRQPCFVKICDDTINGVWRADKWSKCSTPCGRGRRTRRVRCVDEKTGFSVDHSLCGSRKPPQQKICRFNRCPKWKRDKWSEVNFALSVGTIYFYISKA
uniref:Uncharacterized protein n=1 Tax=Romanomermis culicivorax TaxID=13658 RepID=A0A915KJ56_ROMCU